MRNTRKQNTNLPDYISFVKSTGKYKVIRQFNTLEEAIDFLK